jgi:histone H3/H4
MPKEDPLYVKSKVRDYLKTKGVNVSGEFIDGEKGTLNEKIMGLLDDAVGRAKANSRKTIYEKDL